jgi:hypothetical protein
MRLLALSATYKLPLVSTATPLGSFNWPLSEPGDPMVLRRVCACADEDPTEMSMHAIVIPVINVDNLMICTKNKVLTSISDERRRNIGVRRLYSET